AGGGWCAGCPASTISGRGDELLSAARPIDAQDAAHGRCHPRARRSTALRCRHRSAHHRAPGAARRPRCSAAGRGPARRGRRRTAGPGQAPLPPPPPLASAPGRLLPPGLILRVVAASIGGALLGRRNGHPLVSALLGAAGAVGGAVLGYSLRQIAQLETATPDLPWAVAEDGASLLLGWAAVR